MLLSAALLSVVSPAGSSSFDPDLPPATGEPDVIDVENERANRLTVPVSIEGAGPFSFIIDTAAQRTILSHETAESLALEAEPSARVTTLSGGSDVAMVYVPQLQLGQQSYGGLVSPTFPARHIGADGVLGLDSLQDQRILFDFAQRKIAIEDIGTKRRAKSRREIVVTAKRRSGQLVFTKATISGVNVNVIIDTGGEVSIGNMALFRRLRLSSSQVRTTTLVDITGQSVTADYGLTPDLRIGRARFTMMPIAYADIAPFAALGLDKKPSLFLGMNALRQFDRVAIDFANRRIYFQLPEDA